MPSPGSRARDAADTSAQGRGAERGRRGPGRGRVLLEGGLRLVVLGLLGWYLVQVLRTPGGRTVDAARSAELSRQLVRWSTVTNPTRVHVALAYPPPAAERDWLTALAGAGTEVGWSGRALVPTAVALEPLADPAGGADLSVAAPARAQVVLRDALGAFDTVRAEPQGAAAGAAGIRVYVPSPPALLEAAVGPVVATIPLRDSLVLKRLLVLGHAGWETKFVTAALEEQGWQVEALMALSPKGQGDVWQGPRAQANTSTSVGAAGAVASADSAMRPDERAIDPVDTAHYAAVLAIDTVAQRYADQLVRYVQQGGGLVLWPEAAQSTRLAVLAPGVVAGVLPEPGKVPPDAAPRSVLALAPLEHLRSDALALEQQRGRTAVAARRLGPGRVVQLGYLNTWRWRLAGLDGSDRQAIDAHRDWLARLVAQVAYTNRRERSVTAADAAPLATLVDQLGPSGAPPQPSSDLTRVGLWIFSLVLAAALLEWASRRLRGVA